MSLVADKTVKIWMEAELPARPGDGHVHEGVRGEMILNPKDNFQPSPIGQGLKPGKRPL